MSYETLVDDTLNSAGPVNNNFIASGTIKEIYSGTGFDILTVSGVATDAEYEFETISSDDIGNADYIKIEATIQTGLSTGDDYGDGTSASLRIQTKDIGGTYTNSMEQKTLSEFDTDNGISDSMKLVLWSTSTIIWYHTLTTDEKSNGIKIKFITRIGNSTYHQWLYNRQTILSVNA